MKKTLLLFALVAISFTTYSQENSGQTTKGKWVIEANTGAATTGNTMFSLASSDGNTAWSLGLDGGYFFMDDLAVKVGLGYFDSGSADGLNYKIGAEYYFNGNIPVSVDFTGDTGTELNWLGIQAGYAWFVTDHISVKPAVRYNVGLDDQDGVFQGLVGFALFF